MSDHGKKKNWRFERKSPRVPHGGGIIFKPRFGGNVEAKVRDVSENGLYIMAKSPVKVGDTLLLYLPIEVTPNKSKMCIVSGTVIRLGDREEAPGFAISFESAMSKTMKSQLQEFVARIGSNANQA